MATACLVEEGVETAEATDADDAADPLVGCTLEAVGVS